MQHVTIKSSHFAAWTSHLFACCFGGALTGALFGVLYAWLFELDVKEVIGLFGFAGVALYLILWAVWVFVRSALGYEGH